MRQKKAHGAALNNSSYRTYVVIWLQQNPRMTAGKIRERLISRYGVNAEFSEPHIQAWLKNYYPDIINEISLSTKGKAGQSVINLSDSILFGNVGDTLGYYQKMLNLLESRMKEAEVEYDVIKKRIESSDTNTEDLPRLSQSTYKLRDQLMKFSKEISAHRKFMEEWQRTHDIGERIGDAIAQVAIAAMDILLPDIPVEKRKEAIKEFKDKIKLIAAELRVPIDDLYK